MLASISETLYFYIKILIRNRMRCFFSQLETFLFIMRRKRRTKNKTIVIGIKDFNRN
jgi:hypothetical protein